MEDEIERIFELILDNNLDSYSEPDVEELFRLLSQFEEAFSSQFLAKPKPNPTDRQKITFGKFRLDDNSEVSLLDSEKNFVISFSDVYNLNEIFVVKSVRKELKRLRHLRGFDEMAKYLAGFHFARREKIIAILVAILQMGLYTDDYENEYLKRIKAFLNQSIEKGLKNRLFELMKELNSENTSENVFIQISKNDYFTQKEMACIERKGVSECLYLCSLISPLNANEIKDVYSILQLCAKEWSNTKSLSLFKASYSLIFCIANALYSAIQSYSSSNLVSDGEFLDTFQSNIFSLHPDGYGDGIGIMHVVALFWSIFRGAICTKMDQSIQSNDQIKDAVLFSLKDSVFFSALTSLSDMLIRFRDEESQSAHQIAICVQNLFDLFLSMDLIVDKVRNIAEGPASSMSPIQSSLQSQYQVKMDPYEAYELFTRSMGAVYARDESIDIQKLSFFKLIHYLLDFNPISRILTCVIDLLSMLVTSPERARFINQFFVTGYRFCSWSTFLLALTKYELEYKKAVQNSSMYTFYTYDAKLITAYANCSKKIIETRDPDIHHIFNDYIPTYFVLFRFQSVPLSLKAALRSAICAFIQTCENHELSTYLGHIVQQDLPVNETSSGKVYDLLYEFEQIECMSKEYDNTISYIELVNSLLQNPYLEKNLTTEISKFICKAFHFVKENVFNPFNQRSYASPIQKWKLLKECLRNFKLLLKLHIPLYKNEMDGSSNFQAPVITTYLGDIGMLGEEIMRDLMGRKKIFETIVSISKLGVDEFSENSLRDYFPHMENCLAYSFDILIQAFSIDQVLANKWRPHCLPLDEIIKTELSNIIPLLNFARYVVNKKIAKSSLKLMKILNERIPNLASLLLVSSSSKSLIRSYGLCLEEIMNSGNDVDVNDADEQEVAYHGEKLENEPGLMIMDILLSNAPKSFPNLTQFLLDLDVMNINKLSFAEIIEKQNCFGVIFQQLSTWNSSSPSISLFQSHGFRLLSSLCTYPGKGNETITFLWQNNIVFLIFHLNDAINSPLPKHYLSSIQQRLSFLELFSICLWSAKESDPIPIEVLREFLPSVFGIEERTQFKKEIYIMDFLKLPLSLLSKIQTPLSFPQEECTRLELFDYFNSGFLVENGGIFEFKEKRNYTLINFNALRSKINEVKNESLKLNYGKKIIEFAYQYNSRVLLKYSISRYLNIWADISVILVTKSINIFQREKKFLILSKMLTGCFNLLQMDEKLDESLLIDVFRVINAVLKEIYWIKLNPSFPSIDINGDSSIINLFACDKISSEHCFSILDLLLSFLNHKQLSHKLSFHVYNSLIQFLQYCNDYVGMDISKSITDLFINEERSQENRAFFENSNESYIRLKTGNQKLIQKYLPQIITLVDSNLHLNPKNIAKSEDFQNALTYMISFLSVVLTEDNDSSIFFKFEKNNIFERCFSFVPLILAEISRNSSAYNRSMLSLLKSVLNIILQFNSYSPSMVKKFFEFFCLCDELNPPVETIRDPGSHFISNDIVTKKEVFSTLVTPVLKIALNFSSFKTRPISEENFKALKLCTQKFIFQQKNLFFSPLSNYRKDDTVESLRIVELTTAYLCLNFFDKTDLKKAGDFISGLNETVFHITRLHFELSDDSESDGVVSNIDYSTLSNKEKRERQLISVSIGNNLVNYLQNLVTFMDSLFHVNISQFSSRGQNLRRPTLNFILDITNSSLTFLKYFVEEKWRTLSKMKNINDSSGPELQEISSQQFPASRSQSYTIEQLRYFAMKEMSAIISHAEKMVDHYFSIIEHAIYIIVHHLRLRLAKSATNQRVEPITSSSLFPYAHQSRPEIRSGSDSDDSEIGTNEDVQRFGLGLLPTLEEILNLSQERVGKNLDSLHAVSKFLKSTLFPVVNHSQNPPLSLTFSPFQAA